MFPFPFMTFENDNVPAPNLFLIIELMTRLAVDMVIRSIRPALWVGLCPELILSSFSYSSP